MRECGVERKADLRAPVAVTADQIKAWTRKEPRTLAKYDSRKSRPKILANLGITILPIRNGEYLLCPVDGYADTPERLGAGRDAIMQRSPLATLPKIPTTESQVLDSAVAAGVLQKFLGETQLHLTIRGRQGSGKWDFQFGNRDLGRFEVDGVQVEVDGGYEGDSIYLIEAKMGALDSFIVRQLYYPYRQWVQRCPNKTVVPMLVQYHNGRYLLARYRFEHLEWYDSISLVESIGYRFEEESESRSLAQLFARAKSRTCEPPPPFPQANSFEKVVDAIDFVAGGRTSKEELTDLFEFDKRQTDYYLNAARYLGFLESGSRPLKLSAEGRRFSEASNSKRFELAVQAMLRTTVLRAAFEFWFEKGKYPEVPWVEEKILQHRTDVFSSTLTRRAQSVIAWVRWAVINDKASI